MRRHPRAAGDDCRPTAKAGQVAVNDGSSVPYATAILHIRTCDKFLHQLHLNFNSIVVDDASRQVPRTLRNCMKALEREARGFVMAARFRSMTAR
eukprot:scaffold48823_cov27-Tisochrysis_lutea.AAC.7